MDFQTSDFFIRGTYLYTISILDLYWIYNWIYTYLLDFKEDSTTILDISMTFNIHTGTFTLEVLWDFILRKYFSGIFL